MYDVVALGELLIDFGYVSADAAGYPTMAAHPGGAPANYLAAVTKYGYSTALLAKVGKDDFGRLLLNTLEKSGIGTGGVISDDSVFTTLAFVSFDAYGDRSFSFARKPGADTALRWNEVDTGLIDGCRIFHFGTLSLTDEPMKSTTQMAVAYAKQCGKLISLDPNLRLPLWRSPDEAREQILWSLKQADLVKISGEELEFLWGCDAQEGAERLIRDYGVSLAMVTLGADGCLLRNVRASYRAVSPRVKPVDTTGAGDIFGGTAAARFLELGKRPEELSQEELEYIASYAAAAASLSTERPGGIPSVPGREEIEKRFFGSEG